MTILGPLYILFFQQMTIKQIKQIFLCYWIQHPFFLVGNDQILRLKIYFPYIKIIVRKITTYILRHQT